MHMTEINISQSDGIYELSKIIQELKILKDLTLDEILRRDYEIYIRDIQRFLKKSSRKVISSEDIQIYIDDYQEVIQRAKAEEME
ncbi:MAG TPA: hypothetical protein DDW65_17340 [Firmicutes bacterium]|jgi:hypothetical protein|nr:hypothetical protein [Bacillota bacterium]